MAARHAPFGVFLRMACGETGRFARIVGEVGEEIVFDAGLAEALITRMAPRPMPVAVSAPAGMPGQPGSPQPRSSATASTTSGRAGEPATTAFGKEPPATKEEGEAQGFHGWREDAG